MSDWVGDFLTDLDSVAGIPGRTTGRTDRLVEGERRNVAVLFLDLKGFTVLSERLDPEQVQALMDRCFKVFSHVILRNGGYVDKYEGDCIMALFGARVATEGDSARAVSAAVEMFERLTVINELLGSRGASPLGMRIGIHTGLVVTGRMGLEREGDFTVMGDVVNTAARMEQSAAVDTIHITAATRDQAGSGFVYEALGAKELKGKAERIETFRVTGRSSGFMERWERHSLRLRSSFVGREAELERVAEALSRASERGQVAVDVVGPAGIGKSRFVHEALARFGDQAVVVRGGCQRLAAEPYALWADLVRRRSPDLDAVDSPGLRRLLGLVRTAPEDPEEARVEIQMDLLALLQRAAEEASGRTLVVHLDDLHWIDEGSVRVGQSVLGALQPPGGSLRLFVRRPEGPLPPAWGVTNATSIELKPWGRAEVESAIAQMCGAPMSPSFVDRTFARCGGNPFFLEELMSLLVDDGALQRSDGVWGLVGDVDDLQLPDTVTAVILSRIDRLEGRARQLLQEASVLGHTFGHSVLGAIDARLGGDDRELSDCLELLTGLGYLASATENGALAFRHALTREVAYSTLLNRNKRLLHRLAAEALEEVAEPGSESSAAIANHYDTGEVWDQAYLWRFRAGREAQGLSDFGQARRHLERATELADRLDQPPTDLADVWRVLAHVLFASGELDAVAEAVVQGLLCEPSARERAELEVLRARSLDDSTPIDDLRHTLDSIAALCPGDAHDLHSEIALMRSELAMRDLDAPGATEHLQEARSSLGASGCDDLRHRVLVHAVWQFGHGGDEEGLNDVLCELEGMLARIETPALRGRVLALLGTAAWTYPGDLARAISALEEATEIHRRTGALLQELDTLSQTFICRFLCGELHEAERLESLLKTLIAKDVRPEAQANFQINLAELRYRQGRFEEALSEHLDGVRLFRASSGELASHNALILAFKEGHYRRALGERESGLALIKQGRDVWYESDQFMLFRHEGDLTLVEALLDDGRFEEAVPYQEAAEANLVRIPNTYFRAWAAILRGRFLRLTGRQEEANIAQAEAVALAERCPAKGLLAEARLEQAWLLRQGGEQRAADALAERARRSVTQEGAGALAVRLEDYESGASG